MLVSYFERTPFQSNAVSVVSNNNHQDNGLSNYVGYLLAVLKRTICLPRAQIFKFIFKCKASTHQFKRKCLSCERHTDAYDDSKSADGLRRRQSGCRRYKEELSSLPLVSPSVLLGLRPFPLLSHPREPSDFPPIIWLLPRSSMAHMKLLCLREITWSQTHPI